jgi:branched-chain amino acid transport system substrate-binding protein
MFPLFSRSRLWALALGPVSILALALIATACGGEGEATDNLSDTSLRPDAQTPIVVPAGEPIVVGISAPLTGPDAPEGIEDRDAVIVGVERWKKGNGNQIEGHEIEVRAEDDGCTEADITAQAAQRFLRTPGLVGVVGPSCSAGAQAAIPIYAQAGIVAISASATESALATSQPEGGFFFRTAYRNDLEGILAGLFASVALQAEKAYLIDDNEPYGTDLADGAQRALRDNNVVVTRESVGRGTVDFGELAARIVSENPDLVGFAGFNPEAALLYRQLRDAGYSGIFGSVDAAASVPSFVEPVGSAAEGVVFAGCSLTLPEDFVADFEDVHGDAPDASAFVAQDADAATILLDAVAQVAVEQADGSLTIDPAALRDAVRATNLEDGLSGSFTFDENGDRIPHTGDMLSEVVEQALNTGNVDIFVDFGLVPCQVQDGKLVNLLGPGAGQIR